MRIFIQPIGRGVFVGVGVALAACRGSAPRRQAPPTPVRVAAVVVINAPITIEASGVVEPMQTVAVTAQVSGSLREVLFREGEYVEQGQVLFRIDPRPLQAAVDQAMATLRRDEANAEAARKDDARFKTLADMGYVSRSQSDQQHATAVAAAATVDADRAAVRSAEVNLGFTTIRAPIAGRTGSLLVRRGNNVSPGGGALVVINQISPVFVRFPVLQQDFTPLQRAVAAHPLPVVANSSDSTQATERGQLSFLDNAVDSLTGTVTGKASFPNTSHRMWPGELVFLTVQLEVQRGVLAVPNEAIQTGQQGAFVYVVDARSVAETRAVVAGRQVGDLIVVERGLARGERVIIDGQSRVNPGSRVAIAPGSAGTDTGTATLGSVAPTANGYGGTAAGNVSAARPGTPGTLPSGGTQPGGQGGGGPPGSVSAGATNPASTTTTVTPLPAAARGGGATATSPTTTTPTTTTAPTTTPTTTPTPTPAPPVTPATPITIPSPTPPRSAPGTPSRGSTSGTPSRP